MSEFPCPVCGCSSAESILSLDCGNIDNSKLYPTVRLNSCTTCGHAFNVLSPGEITGLDDYYNNEYAPANLNSVVKDGDLPGSTGLYTRGRYLDLYEMLAPQLNQNGSVLDVGCAVGGFLDFLKQKGFTSLFGVDTAEAYVDRACEKQYVVELGNAEQLPFADCCFDALVIEQVMEHLVHPWKAFREAGRVLKPGGVLCIGVPDASRYPEFYFYDFYWLLMREHIQHFDIHGLSHLASLHGFELVDFRQSSHPIMGEKMVMPSLSASFRYQVQADCVKAHAVRSSLPNTMKHYVETETARLEKRRDKIRKIRDSQRPVYVWGVGREFLYLYESAGLKDCNLAGFIDMNPFKQSSVQVNGKAVESDEKIGLIEKDAILIITAIAHEGIIKENAYRGGYNGEIVSIV